MLHNALLCKGVQFTRVLIEDALTKRSGQIAGNSRVWRIKIPMWIVGRKDKHTITLKHANQADRAPADSPPEDITLEIYPGRSSSARLIWDASGHATELTLQPASTSWRVLVSGEQQAHWLVRWHTTQGIVEQDAGTGQSFSLEMA